MRLSTDITDEQLQKLLKIKKLMQAPSKAETVRRLIIERKLTDVQS